MSAAEDLFLKRGVARATIEQITFGANVAKGTFYLYFSSKDDVLAALRDRFAQQLLAKIKTAIAKKRTDDWKGKLATWVDACVSGYLDSMRLHDILFYGFPAPTRHGLVKNIVIDHLIELFQSGVHARAWSIDDPQLTAVFLFNGLHSVVDVAHGKAKRTNPGALAHKVQRLCLRAIGKSSA
ncbi:MAG TPA: TetR/AcrR family transcriptional regulator [Candidatus Acidoferrales bacterium]|jgi:AcrR family transcriptional regulator